MRKQRIGHGNQQKHRNIESEIPDKIPAPCQHTAEQAAAEHNEKLQNRIGYKHGNQ